MHQYKAGSSSIHGKARVEAQEGGGSSLVSRDGVKLVRVSKVRLASLWAPLGLLGTDGPDGL
jgi:hypothetical protein